jgi:hypothetical protein
MSFANRLPNTPSPVSVYSASYSQPLTRTWEQHPDLARERSLASFTTRQLRYFLDGGPANTERIEAIRRILDRELLFDKTDIYHLDHEHQYYRAIKIMERVRALQQEHK